MTSEKDCAMNYTQLSLYSSELEFYECDKYEFEGDDNIISEWNLVCDRSHLVSVVEMCFLAGAAVGSICSGWVSDRFGRRHTLLILATTQTVFGMYAANARRRNELGAKSVQCQHKWLINYCWHRHWNMSLGRKVLIIINIFFFYFISPNVILCGTWRYSIWTPQKPPNTGTLLAFSNSLTMFMILRVIIGFASMGVTMVSFVLVVELVSGKWRTVIGILDILPVALSYIIIAGIAYMTPNWRTTQLVISVPWFALLLIWYELQIYLYSCCVWHRVRKH